MTRTALAIVVLLLSAGELSAQAAVRVPESMAEPTRTSSAKPLVTTAPRSTTRPRSASAASAAAAVTIPSRELNRLRIRRSGAETPLPDLPVVSGARPLSTTMPSDPRDGGERQGRDRDYDRHDRDRHDRDRHHGWGYNPGYYGTGVEVGIEIAEIGIEIADIGLHGLRDDRIVGNWRGYRGPGDVEGGYADVIAVELTTELPAARIEVDADGSYAWGDLRGQAREIVPHFARGGDRFFLIRDGADEYVIMIDADGEARLLDGVDAIRRGEHLR